MTELLTLSGWQGIALRFALLYLAIAGGVFAFRLVRSVVSLMPRPNLVWFVMIGLLSIVGEIMRPVLIDLSAVLFAEPVYESDYTSASTDWKTAAFERELQKKVSPAEFAIIQQATAQTAAKIGCAPSDIYAVAYCECGLDPFKVRDDGVAAGWIQFTGEGVKTTPGLTLNDVKKACYRRDVVSVMQWTDNYLVNAANGRKLENAAAVYIAVFAPAKIGQTGVLYSGKNNPSYYLNDGIDGWVKMSDGRILHRVACIDYRITAGELALMLEYKAGQILKK